MTENDSSQPSSSAVSSLAAWRSSSTRTIVFLHGFGGHPDSYDLAPLNHRVGSTAIIRAVGPLVTETGFMWWDGDNVQDPSPEALATALDALANQLARTTEPVVLVGFSQGAAAALEMALHPPSTPCPPIAAVVAVAGFLATPPAVTLDAPPVLFVHPTDDGVVDIFLAERATRLLGQRGVDATLEEIEGDHEWSNAVVAPVANFLLHH